MNSKTAQCKRNLTILTMAMLTACTGCASRTQKFRGVPRSARIPSGDVRLPIDWWCDFAVVPVVINGEGPFNFLLDTGASQSVVDKSLANRFSESVFSHNQATRGSSGRRVKVTHRMRISELEAGDVRFEEFDALVMDLSVVSETLGTPLDGILGCPLFRGSILVMDFPRREVYLRAGSLKRKKRPDQFRATGAQRPYVALSVGDDSIPCLVDTGAGSGISLDEETFSTIALQGDPIRVSVTVGVAGKLTAWKAARAAEDIRFGPHVVNTPIVKSSPGNAVVGLQILRYFRLTYDHKNHVVRLERDSDEPIRMQSLRGTGVAMSRRPDQWRIRRVLDFAGLEAKELQKDDVILRVEGVPAMALDCDAYRELLSTRDSLRLDVRRGDQTLTVQIPVVGFVK